MFDRILPVCVSGLLGLACASAASAQSYIVTSAGTGSPGYNGDHIPAASAEIYAPSGLALDAAGNLYISDTANGRIRKVSASNGLITTVAGGGNGCANQTDSVGDGCPATSAQIVPYAVAVDGTGNLYIADNNNLRIRKVTASTGVITTIAGDGKWGFTPDGVPATSASTYQLSGIAVDDSGNVYFSEEESGRVRMVPAATGILTTFAGGGNGCAAQTDSEGDGCPATSAEISSPYGISFDASGNLLIAEEYNCRIRKVAASSGIITTVAGTGVKGFNGDNIPATMAELYFPTGVHADSAGNIYISDNTNGRIRKVSAATGMITTVAGDAGLGYNGDNILAIDAELNYPWDVVVNRSGNLLIADSTNERIRETVPLPQTAAPVFTPSGGTFFAGQTVAISDSNPNATIYCTTDNTIPQPILADLCISPIAVNKPTTISAIATAPNYIQSAENLQDYSFITGTPVFTPGGGTYSHAQMVTVSDATPGATIYCSTGKTPPLPIPANVCVSPIALDSQTTLSAIATSPNYSQSDEATTTYSFTGSDVIRTVAGYGVNGYNGDNHPATVAKLNVPTGVAVDSSGDFFIADSANNRIRKVSSSTGVITTVAGSHACCFSGDGGPATSAALYNPVSVAVDSAGNLYIADNYNDRIREVSASTGIITTVAGSGCCMFGSGNGGPATSAQLADPVDVAVDGAGNIYIDDYTLCQIRKVTASTGIINTIAGDNSIGYSGDGGPATSAELFYPAGIAVDNSGNLYIADTGNNRIRKVTASTGIITTVAGNGTAGFTGDGGPATSAELDRPLSLALDAAGNLYINDSNGMRIRELIASTGTITTLAGNGIQGFAGDGGSPLAAELNSASGIAVDAVANVYVADTGNSRIREIGPPQTATPSFTPRPGSFTGTQSVTVSDATPNATIYCSTGSTPPLPIPANVCSNPYVLNSQTTLNAVATAPSFNQSFVASATYRFRVAEVAFLEEVPSASGASTTVYLGEAMAGASIYYTTDGSIPQVGAADTSLYTGPIVVTKPETIKAVGVLAGLDNSWVSTKSVLLPAAQPVISPGTGVFVTPQTVTITDATAAATLYCILDGAPAVPCAPSYLVNSSQEIVAYAEGGGFSRSIQSSAFYDIK